VSDVPHFFEEPSTRRCTISPRAVYIFDGSASMTNNNFLRDLPSDGQKSGTSCSVPEMEVEHHEILTLANDLKGAIQSGLPRGNCRDQLLQLIDSTEKHFAAEEALMLSSGYGGYQSHKEEHARLLVQLHLIEGDLASHAINPCGALSLFVEIQAVHHMRGPDNHFAAFLNETTRATQPEPAPRQLGAAVGKRS
jgi:hemerythrin